MPDFTDYRYCGQYRCAPNKWTEANGIAPNEAWRSKDDAGHRRCMVSSIKQPQKDHWSVSVGAIEWAKRREADNECDRAFVLFEDADRNLVATHTISEILLAIKGADPIKGYRGFGNFYFFTKDLRLGRPGVWETGDDF